MSIPHNTPLIYVVEDSMASGALYSSYLSKAGYEVKHIIDGHSALVAIKERMPDVIVQDVCLPDISGLDVLQFVNKQESPARVVVMTSNSSIDVAVNAMRMGGYDFIEKPFGKDLLLSSVSNALQQIDYEAFEQKTDKADEAVTNKTSDFFIGESLAMNTVFRTLDSAASSKASVFITGESGTGKEVCAMSLHKSGARREGPFIAMNCAAIPKDLFESEFFGHKKGAFSGALSDRKGAVELADGGTLFLDELCEMDLGLQAKLLRFLQTGAYTPVGGSKELHSDVRIISATNRIPAEEVGEGRFREDLYYRLNVIPVKLPPLRERGDDILLLASHFLKEKATENFKEFNQFSPEVKQRFLQYEWSGNVRELQNIIENIVVINNGEIVVNEMLPPTFAKAKIAATNNKSITIQSEGSDNGNSLIHNGIANIRPLEDVEREAIENAIAWCDGNIPLAAAHLGVSASTIYRKVKTWHVLA